MTIRSFAGGIRPPGGKELTKNAPVKIVLPGKELVYPLTQYGGGAAKALVKAGEKVLCGPQIAASKGADGVPIHASVSGRVVGIKPRRIYTGEEVKCVVVENDGLYDEVDIPAPRDPEEMEEAEILARIEEAGIVGLSGGGFPTHLKMQPPQPKKIAYLIVNGVECEPFLTGDCRLMLEETERLIAGIKVLLRLFPYARGAIAVTTGNEECLELLRERTDKEQRIDVRGLRAKYPQGAERQLVAAATGRALDSAQEPADVGCIIVNVATVIAVYNAVVQGRNLISRIVTVSGDAVIAPQNFGVRLGTSMSILLEAAGGFRRPPEKIIVGGPLMGFAINDANVPVAKETGALLCFSKDEIAAMAPTACINCGRCAEVCPERLWPARLAELAERGDSAGFRAYGGQECSVCGCCAYACPAKRFLTQAIGVMLKTL
ncbi:MAG: electron transport complex subunit RsxC [Lachnospiraceae bacterium]|jgi:electron transport complex protein RnfC|nr:electron transport complex subunit RsxC [Lachnospiraceae bacterium]